MSEQPTEQRKGFCKGRWFLRRRRREWFNFHNLGDDCRCTRIDSHKGKHICKCGSSR